MDKANITVVIPELIEILKRKYADQDPVITPETRIFHDLMIYGGDSIEFLDEVSQKYHIVKPVFDGGIYFPDEESLLWFFLWIWPRLAKRWEPLTVEELATYVVKGIELR